MKLYDLLVSSAERGLSIKEENGFMPAGSNGPYGDDETPIRNTSHWSILFLKAFEITGKEAFRDAAEDCLDFIVANGRPNSFTFEHRISEFSDNSNGLIGQAWTIEALANADRYFETDKYARLAEEVFSCIPFNEELGLWKIIDVDGTITRYDFTFNHQLWLAATASMLESMESKRKIEIFTGNLNNNLSIFEDGLIKHHIYRQNELKNYFTCLKDTDNFRMVYGGLKDNFMNKFDLKNFNRYKSIGYHSFNTYAFALLDENTEKNLENIEKVNKALNFCKNPIYQEEILENEYGYPYNPPGIENAFTLYYYCNNTEEEKKWMNQQIKKTFNFETNLMNKGQASDKKTYAARLYEATRLPNYKLKQIN